MKYVPFFGPGACGNWFDFNEWQASCSMQYPVWAKDGTVYINGHEWVYPENS